MSENQIRALLGPPDSVSTQEFLGEKLPSWDYGTHGPGRLATLGKVVFYRGEACAAYGSKLGVVAPPVLAESRLRELMLLLNWMPGDDWFLPQGGEWDPLPFIRLVNALHVLGRATALAVIDEFCRVTSAPRTPEERFARYWSESGRPSLCALAYVLFGPIPEKVEETLDIGIDNFGISVIQGVPLMLSHGGGLGGYTGFSSYHVDVYNKHGVLRPSALRPADQPWLLVGALDQTREWRDAADAARSGLRHMVMNQVLRLVSGVYATEQDSKRQRIAYGPDLEDRWSVIAKAIQRLNPTWHGQRNTYVSHSGR